MNITACPLGYFGSLCDTPCLPGFYGEYCAGACHPLCSKDECDPKYGCKLTTADIIPGINSEKNLLFETEGVNERVLSQSEFNSSYLLLGMGGITCVFLFVIVLQLCKKSYSRRRKHIHSVSQAENNFHHGFEFHHQEGNQSSCDTVSRSMETAHSPPETKYDDINEILQTRRLFISELANVYDRANYL
uniref:Uncharacterized protein LOC111103575 n=1 Tax=Crassostrea virginica TaxID=6565 RepID=A0A8B8AM81_CRAVI|nr:uncharacterized protein LOC111103575 [Crassostrea virginica]XP_022292642.1 uncharacterized protein LOC111103575 [Crassostrea virginica]